MYTPLRQGPFTVKAINYKPSTTTAPECVKCPL